MVEFLIFMGSWPWPWIGSYCIPSCITRRPLPTYQISLKSKKLFVDGRTYGRTDIWDPLMLLGRLGGVDLINREVHNMVYCHTGLIHSHRVTCVCSDMQAKRQTDFAHLMQVKWKRYQTCIWELHDEPKLSVTLVAGGQCDVRHTWHFKYS